MRTIDFLDKRVNGITGSPRYIRNNKSFLTEDPVYQGRFPRIRLTYHRNFYCITVIFRFRFNFLKFVINSVKQISYTEAVSRRDSNRVSETEIIKLIKIHRNISRSVELVHA